MKRFLVPSLVLALALAGCGGGGGGGSTPPKTTPTSTPTTPSGKTGSVTVTINWPSAVGQSNPLKRKPQYISNSTQSITVYLNGTAATTINNPCTTGPVTVSPGSTRRTPANATLQSACTSTTTTIIAPQGYNTFGATGFDGMNGAGTALATSVTPTGYTVTAGTNVVTVQMNGIVSTMSVDTSGIHMGSSVLKVYALDPDGNIISGTAPYANAMTVALSDPFGSFTGAASTTFTAPMNTSTGENDITLTYNGNNDCTAQFLMTAPAVGALAGAASNAQSLQAPAAGGSVGAWFGRARLCWAPLTGATTYSIYRGTSAGGESPTAIATTNLGSNTYQDYTARAGSTYYYKVCTGPLATSTCSTEFSGAPSGDVDNYFGATTPTYWYDINDQSTVTTTQVQDKSGNGNTLSLTGMVNTASAISGRNALAATVGAYARTSGGSISPAAGVTVFVVASQTGNAGPSSGNYQRLINFGYANDGTGFVGTAPNGATQGLVASFFGNGTTWYSKTFTGPATSWNANPSVYVVQSDGSSTPTYGGTGIGSYSWFNGNAMNNVPQGNFAAVTGMDIGAYVSAGNLVATQGWNGYIAEIIVYPLAQGTVGTTQRQKIEGYLACKWGFQGSLPASHPYAFGKSCP